MVPEIVTDIEPVDGLREEWNSLLSFSAANNLFLTWEWISSWCTHMLRKTETPLIITAREGGRLVGIAPLMCEKHRFLGDYYHLIGQQYSYHLGFIAEKRNEKNTYKALWNHLFKIAGKSYSEIGFIHLREDLKLESSLGTQYGAKKFRVERSIRNPCIVLVLPDSYETYLRKGFLSENIQDNLRRYFNKLNKEHIFLYFESGKDDFDKHWLEMLRLHRAKMNTENRHSVLQGSAFPDHLRNVALLNLEANATKLGVLKIDGKTASILFGILYCGCFYAITIGIDPEMQMKYKWLNICVVSHSMSIKSAIENYCSEFDFLGGKQEFKYKMGGKEKDGIKLTVFRSAIQKYLINSTNWFSDHIKNSFANIY